MDGLQRRPSPLHAPLWEVCRARRLGVPDGYFYGLSGSNGSIDKGIRVEQRGTYTLAIWNKSDEAVAVEGTVNY